MVHVRVPGFQEDVSGLILAVPTYTVSAQDMDAFQEARAKVPEKVAAVLYTRTVQRRRLCDSFKARTASDS